MKYIIYQPRCYYYTGGGEVVAFKYISGMVKRGMNCVLVVSRSKNIKKSELFEKFVQENIEVEIVYIDVPDNLNFIYEKEPGSDWFRWDQESIFLSKLALPILNELSKKEVCKFVAHNIIDVLALPENNKIILHLHGYPAELNYVCKLILSNPNYYYVSVSEKIKEKFLQMSMGKIKINVVKNGVDPSDFDVVDTQDKKYDVLFLGRLIENKGVMNLIDSLILLANKNIRPRVAIAGIGPLEETIRKKILNAKLSNVHMLGYVHEDEKKYLYNSTRTCCFPSLDKEGTLLTMLEASVVGVPVITTKSSSMNEFIIDNENGFLMNSHDCVDVSEKLEYVLCIEDSVLQEIGANAKKDIMKDWTWDHKIDSLIKLYENI